MIDFGLADFRETFGAGYVAGKRGKLIHNEPHRAQPLYSLNAQGSKEQLGGRYSSEAQLQRKASTRSKFKFFHMPAGLLPEASTGTPPPCLCYLHQASAHHPLAAKSLQHCLTVVPRLRFSWCCACCSIDCTPLDR